MATCCDNFIMQEIGSPDDFLMQDESGDVFRMFQALRGPGVPAGGTAGQILAKVSSTDFDTAWTTLETITDAQINALFS